MACTATVVACSSCHGSSARCPLINWRLPNIEIITLHINESFGSSVGWQNHTCKHALCMPSPHTAAVCSRRHAFGPLCFARPRAPIPDAVEAKAHHMRRLGEDLSSRACFLGLSHRCDSECLVCDTIILQGPINMLGTQRKRLNIR